MGMELIRAAAADVALRYLGVQGAIELRNRLIVEEYHKGGVTYAELAKVAGLSHQRIHQLVHEDGNGAHD